MRNKKVILFDLDGTLSDPKVGITKSVQYALQKMSISVNDLTKLEIFIGPPLQDSFSEEYGFNEKEVKRAIELYRERFVEKGMFENHLYPGIQQLLERLKTNNKLIVIATSKPTLFAEKIVDYFQIDPYFDLIVGSNLDGSRISKTEIIKYAMDQYPEYENEQFLMIGDRKHDVIGANNNQISSIGVTFGYGTYEELSEYTSTTIVHSVGELEECLLAGAR
ncbi:phosphoglycolate phosphatase [Bacillus pakistanensis]|uniref:Phosphoglycolate phosphatase n=1 Tax=Rossellomorea pakistanensis TaxID=992288 RepID=A0ABS2NDU0_9BACI|nr:HAD family hydrolase [Bacillus pakistanensis]MBM7586019.1 phosphoglycolate phosphatase [Bacillus pakistanensis]